jgi:hypothetical protein
MQAMQRFMLGMWKTPVAVRLWLALLIGTNMFGPLVFIGRLEAQVALATAMLGAMLMAVITARTGFSRLLGLGHAPFVPMLAFVGWRLATTPIDGTYRTWLIALLVVNAISLTFDTVDVIRWLRGERGEMVDGLPPCAAAA